MTRVEGSAPAIVFEHLSVRRGNNQILEDICASVPRGGNTVLVGPNGAGKTTLLLCLIGEAPYTGRILPDGRRFHLYQKTALLYLRLHLV